MSEELPALNFVRISLAKRFLILPLNQSAEYLYKRKGLDM
jgi:hypothetical protein